MNVVQSVTGALAAALLWAGVAQAQPADEAAAAPSIWDGVFSEAQAERGRAAYFASCSQCHGAQLEGVEDSPDIAGQPFVNRWAGAPVGAVFDYARTQMPLGRPGSLGTQAYADIVAFMLLRSGFPSGEREMPADADALYEIIIEARP